jgi:selenide,water dikinase
MNSETDPRKPGLLLVGAGHAHIEVLRQAALRRAPGPRIVLALDRNPTFYSGMLPGFVAGRYRAAELAIDAVALARRAAAEVVLEAVARIDAQGRQALTESGRTLAYAIASLDVGSTVAGGSLPGVGAHALAVRPIERLIAGVEALIAASRERSQGAPLRVLVVGAGAGGVELAFCLEARLRAEAGGGELTLLDRSEALLPGAPAALVRRVQRAAARRGIRLVLAAEVVALEPGAARLAGGRVLAADAILWSPGPAAHAFPRDSGLPVDERGFVRVRPTLQVEGHDDLFAVGDCASLAGMPKAGVYAVRAGPLLAENLRRREAGLALRAFRPQREFLSLLNLGDGTAIGVKRGVGFEGRWVFWLKHAIDRRFVARYRVREG